MKIAVLREHASHEQRVAISPDAVKKYLQLGFDVAIESGAGTLSGFSDAMYEEAGATLSETADDALNAASIILCVNAPSDELVDLMPVGAQLVGMLAPHEHKALLQRCAARQVDAFALELLPRISRAQSMDVLSSQSNLAGYRAVIDAVAESSKATPMMMTAAGTVPPAKALILGAGVAGLQAIATAKRLGAVVSAFDVRPAVREQVQSLGATFIEVPAEESGEAAGGYAKEMSEDYQRKQSELIAETLKKQDIVITTALIPGKKAPVLITQAMVEAMKTGAVIVDLAVASGGNCPLSQPNKTVDHHGVLIIGYTNMPARVAADASALYARNLYHFVSTLMVKDKALATQWDDELVSGTLLTREGAIVHPAFLNAAQGDTHG
ncbi:MAG: Re/Si-specific NAD(P)(+) transhydrogenase subunit alpha [Rickettsiales bacterium]|nr:Re/Si-specific NAD(P)(+) transhydrogenase subunit alpha [Rickettsiales bacterium]